MTSGEDLFIAISGFAIVVLFIGTLYFMGKKDKEEQKEKVQTGPTTADGNFDDVKELNIKSPVLTLGTVNSSNAQTQSFSFDEFNWKSTEPLNEEAKVIKKKKGKKTTWGCSLCPSKEYKHGPSAYNHIKNKH